MLVSILVGLVLECSLCNELSKRGIVVSDVVGLDIATLVCSVFCIIIGYSPFKLGLGFPNLLQRINLLFFTHSLLERKLANRKTYPNGS